MVLLYGTPIWYSYMEDRSHYIAHGGFMEVVIDLRWSLGTLHGRCETQRELSILV
jgi:hypothetical protein